MYEKTLANKEDSEPHPSVVGAALVDLAIGRGSKSSGAVGLVAWRSTTTTIDKIERHSIDAVRGTDINERCL